MNFDAIAQYVAQWAPYVFGGAVVLLASASISQKVVRIGRIRRAHALMARIVEMQARMPPPGASQKVGEELKKKAEALSSELVSKLASETDEEKRQAIAKELHGLDELKAELVTQSAELERLDAERAELDAEVLESAAFLSQLEPPLTVATFGKSSFFSLSNRVLRFAEYIGNVSTKPKSSDDQTKSKETQQ